MRHDVGPVAPVRATRPGGMRGWWPVVVDGVCLVAFVVGGRESHEVRAGAAWFAGVLWPVAAGWYGAALLTGLYRAGPARRAWFRWGCTVVGGATGALVLRTLVQDRVLLSTFALVLLAFLAATTGGWRVAVTGLGRLRRPAAGLNGRGAR